MDTGDNENPDKELKTIVIVFRRGDGVRVEEQLQLGHLEKLMYYFQHHRPAPGVSSTTSSNMYSSAKKVVRTPGLLTPDEFKDTLSKVLGTHEYDDQMESLFMKLDTSCDGYVDWNEFCTYMLLQLRENDYMRSKKQIPFQTEPKIRHIVHNRQETTTKIIAVDNPMKYVTVSKEGALSVFDQYIHFERHYTLSDGDEDPRVAKRRIKMWVTDAVYMCNCHKIAIASSGRDIRFFDTTSSNYFEEFNLYSMPNVPTSMTYYYEKKNPGAQSLLIFGDDKGAVNILTFPKPMQQLFNAPFKKEEGIQKIYFPELPVHSQWVRHVCVEDVHPDLIRKVMYIPDNDCVLCSSASPRNSLVMLDVQRAKKNYIWKINKGVECFDYNKMLNIIVTGSADHYVRIWNPYVTSKPTAILEGHVMGIIDVAIHEKFNQVFSYSRDAVLKVWDVKEHTCLQTVVIKFPMSLLGRTPEYGPFSLHLQNSGGGAAAAVLIAANDYIALCKLGNMGPPVSTTPTTHLAPLSEAIYNPVFKTVVTGADDSTVAVWDLETGSKSMLFTNTHGKEEITAMTFDPGWRRLITAARNGTVKIWNIQNGHNLHELESISEAEVTGIVPVKDKNLILTVGWSRQITQYDDADSDNHVIKANRSWKGGSIHKEDILAVAYMQPNLLATASFDGHICIWTLETQTLFLTLRKGQTPKISNQIQQALGLQPAIRSATSRNNSTTPTTRTPTPSNNNSRPNSRHRKSHRPPPGHAAPVDKLMFLEARAKVKGTEAAVLISSEAGTLRWWSIYGSRHDLGSFYAPRNPDESVLGLCTNTNNSILVCGDTQGCITMWNIMNYCTAPTNHRVKHSPELECSWQAHAATVVSVELLVHTAGTFIVSASSDHTAKLFSLQGLCVGTFGQRELWNLQNPRTWEEVPPDCVLEEEEAEGEDEDEDFDEGEDELLSLPGEDNAERCASQSPVAQLNGKDFHNKKELEEDIEDPPTLEKGDTLLVDRSDDMLQNPDTKVKAASVGPNALRTKPSVEFNFGNRSQTFAYGSTSNFTTKTLLGDRVERSLAKKIHDRQERRGNYGEIDPKNMSRMKSLCCPYQALATPSLTDIKLPDHLPMTPRMSKESSFLFSGAADPEQASKDSIGHKPYTKLPAIGSRQSGSAMVRFSDTTKRKPLPAYT